MEYTFTERQLASVLTEAVKICLNEEKMNIKKNLEGADIQINSAGTIHVEDCEIEGDSIKMCDTNEREIIMNMKDFKSLLDGEKVNATLFSDDDTYDVFISIAHVGDNQRMMRGMRDRQCGDSPIFGGSEM